VVWEIDASLVRAFDSFHSHYDLENFVLMIKDDGSAAGCLIFFGLIALVAGVAGFFGWLGVLFLGIVLVILGVWVANV